MKYIVLLLSLFCCFQLNAGFSNSGKMQSKNLQISTGGTLENNGELIGTTSATLCCDTLSGNGLIQAPSISITAKTFDFKGTIDCSNCCTITTATPFKKKMFKRSGGGEFIFVVDETLNETEKENGFFEDEESLTFLVD